MTNKKKHTPGPWYRDDLLPPNGRTVIARTTGGIPISATTDDWIGYEGEDEANAHLIAAAPELLEALKDAHAQIADDRLRHESAKSSSRPRKAG